MIYLFEECELDVGRVALRRQGSEARIEPQVFDLLRFLIERRGQVVRKEELLDGVWGDRFVSESALTTRIKSLRQAVGDDGSSQRVIRTVHGKGYEFIADVRVADEPATADGVARPAWVAPAGSVLPVALHVLVGRERLLEQLQTDMATSRLLTLVGTGGVGKTSLAFELARRIAGNYRDGVHLVELVTVLDEDATSEAFATALDVSTALSTSIEEAIVDVLRVRRVLVVLDNCEHLIERVAALVGRILGAAPEVSILATSREPLSLPGEHVWDVEPLPTGDVDDTTGTGLASVPAVALFVERAREADPTFELSGATAAAVLEICRRLDGIPLAIELAASLARSVDVTEIAVRLDERFTLLNGVRRGVDPRHRTLRDVISWSYDLLDDDEQRLFASLAVFAGQFDLGVAESVCRGQDVLGLLTRLTQRSMLVVRRSPLGGTRYEMLETLREYGRSRLDDDRSVELFGTHARQFAAIARSVAADLGTPQEGTAVRRADGSFADLRAAQRFAFEVEDFDTGFALVCAAREYAMRTMRYEVFTWAASWSHLPGGVGHRLHPTVMGVQAYGAFVRGEFESALSLAYAARTIEVAQSLAPSGLVERVLANVLSSIGELESGMVEMARVVEVADASGDNSRLAHACYMRSVGESSVGNFDEANRLIHRARKAALLTGSPTDLASASVAEGFATRDGTAALEAFALADRLARSGGNRWMSAFARTEASGLLIHQGRIGEACDGLAEMVDVWYRAGEWAQQWHTMSRCLIALDRIGQLDVAAQVLGAIDSHTAIGSPPVMSTLRDLALETRDSVDAQLGEDRSDEQRAVGASLSMTTLVERTRSALLGRPIAP